MPYKNPQSPRLVAQRAKARLEIYRTNPLRKCSKCRKLMRVINADGSRNFSVHSVASDGIRPYCYGCERQYDRRKRVFREEVGKIKKRIRNAPLREPCQLSILRKRMWTKQDIRRYFGFSRITLEALLLKRFCMTIPREIRFPPGLLQFDMSKPFRGARWTKACVLRWERERFLPNAAIFFAHIREWKRTGRERPIRSYVDAWKQYVIDREKRGRVPIADPAWRAAYAERCGLRLPPWTPRPGWKSKAQKRNQRRPGTPFHIPGST